jgi:hypothetical protein
MSDEFPHINWNAKDDESWSPQWVLDSYAKGIQQHYKEYLDLERTAERMLGKGLGTLEHQYSYRDVRNELYLAKHIYENVKNNYEELVAEIERRKNPNKYKPIHVVHSAEEPNKYTQSNGFVQIIPQLREEPSPKLKTIHHKWFASEVETPHQKK